MQRPLTPPLFLILAMALVLRVVLVKGLTPNGFFPEPPSTCWGTLQAMHVPRQVCWVILALLPEQHCARCPPSAPPHAPRSPATGFKLHPDPRGSRGRGGFREAVLGWIPSEQELTPLPGLPGPGEAEGTSQQKDLVER